MLEDSGKPEKNDVWRSYLIHIAVALTALSCNSAGPGEYHPAPQWQNFTTANSGLHNNAVSRITVAYNQRIWFSTNALRFDSYHNLWIGTPQGVAVYNPAGVVYH